MAARPWIRTVVLSNRTNLTSAFTALRTAGIRRISCIGGRSVAADLLALKLIDDVYLTTSVREGGVPGTPVPADALDGDVVLEKHGTADDCGVVFEQFDLREDENSVRNGFLAEFSAYPAKLTDTAPRVGARTSNIERSLVNGKKGWGPVEV